MYIYYRDALGITRAELDWPSVAFLDGEALFSVNGEEYRIPVENVVEIGMEG